MDGVKTLWDQALSQKLSPYSTEIEFRETIARCGRVEREESSARNLIEQDFLKPVSHTFFGEKVLVSVNRYGAEHRLYGNSVGTDGIPIHYITNSHMNDKAFADMKKVVLKPNEAIQPDQGDTAWFFSKEELEMAAPFLR